jgi:hypothetical protein
MHTAKSLVLASILCLVLVPACALLQGGPDEDPELDLLVDWMTGAFSSQAQAEVDPSFFDIRLHMVRIWPERADGCWLYVEQAAADSMGSPYRQRVYHVTRKDADTLVSAVYELEEPLQYAGVWKEADPLSQLSPDALKERQGAAIYLKMQADGTFAGSTDGKKCVSNFRGAAYATSHVKISRTQVYSWDRGFDAKDKQVWGAVKGGYVFLKLENY